MLQKGHSIRDKIALTICFTGFVFGSGIGISVLRGGILLLAILDFIMSGIFVIIGTWILIKPGAKLPHLFILLFTSIFFLYLFHSGGVANTGFIWGLLIPVASLFFLGLKPGTIFSALYLLIISGIYFFDTFVFQDLNMNKMTWDLFFRFIIVYFISGLISFIYEKDSVDNQRKALNEIKTRKIAEQELLKLTRAVEQSSSIIVITDLTGNIEYVNKRFEKTTGYQFNEVVGKNPRILKTGHTKPNEYRNLWKTISNGREWNGEFCNKRKDGTFYWENALISPIRDAEGTITHFMAVKEDITDKKKVEQALKQSEEKYRTLFEANNDMIGIFHIDDNGKASTFIEANSAAVMNLSRNNSKKELMQMHPDDIEAFFDEDKIKQRIEELKKRGFTHFETKVRYGNGNIADVEIKAIAINYMNQPAILNISRDITDRKKAEEELKIAKKKAESASKAKSEFLANMSHEIRTPLSSVIGFTDLLNDTPLTDEQKQYANNANSSARTLLDIIDNILDLSKIEAGSIDLELIKTDIFDLIEGSLDIIKFPAFNKNLEILLDIDPLVPEFAVVDPVRLKQILTNLLSNAVKFTNKGEVELKVSYKPLGPAEGKFSFIVRDTGIGITDSQKDKLFMAFSQADSSITRKYGGTGLGLVISDMIAKKMGSKIHFKSSGDQGSTFFFDLIAETETNGKTDISEISKIKNCLIIDDNIRNCHIIKRIMENWDIKSEFFTNGPLALNFIEDRKNNDIIIFDCNMPDIDAKLIRSKAEKKQGQHIITMLLPDKTYNHDIFNPPGFSHIIYKPVIISQLFRCLSRICSPESTKEAVLSQAKDNSKYFSGKFKVLISEDNSLNIKIIRALLKKVLPDAVLIEALNGRDAIEQYKKTKPNIIFMDIQMPEMDGYEATKAIRKLEEGSGIHTPIIALTAGVFKEDHENSIVAGMDHFLAKPLKKEKLIRILSHYFNPDN